MLYKRGNTAVAQRTYTYDTLGRPLTRTTARNGQTVNDTFGYNNRSELTTATVNGGSYAYDYDNIGNRKTAQEAAEEITGYTTNNLNQYTALTVDGDIDFQPEYDADGNQCRVKTSTGIWAISYDAENRPTDFTSQAADGTITSVHCEYDYMGRRTTKMVTVGNNVTLQQRYIYRGYLQIACIDLTRSHHPALWFITWDPTQPVVTRPLAIQKDGSWFTYGWDLTKNICELYGPSGYIRTAYNYTPYGQVSSTGDVEQPIQWSSEFNDTELGLVYYNYRHYNPMDGRWTGRDSIVQNNLYQFVSNKVVGEIDYLGLYESLPTKSYETKDESCIFIPFVDIVKHKNGRFRILSDIQDYIEEKMRDYVTKTLNFITNNRANPLFEYADIMKTSLKQVPYLYVYTICICKCIKQSYEFLRFYDQIDARLVDYEINSAINGIIIPKVNQNDICKKRK